MPGFFGGMMPQQGMTGMAPMMNALSSPTGQMPPSLMQMLGSGGMGNLAQGAPAPGGMPPPGTMAPGGGNAPPPMPMPPQMAPGGQGQGMNPMMGNLMQLLQQHGMGQQGGMQNWLGQRPQFQQGGNPQDFMSQIQQWLGQRPQMGMGQATGQIPGMGGQQGQANPLMGLMSLFRGGAAGG